jgi:hypothetical protein
VLDACNVTVGIAGGGAGAGGGGAGACVTWCEQPENASNITKAASHVALPLLRILISLPPLKVCQNGK